ncbi:alpha/beta hydrolase [Frankia sp. CiP3]|uniref:RBBP9/YdeN family alpha/beta hydrolase n=1 Tax=Frankia sp. CiP3 TaxID=2880971 RepID=UPI001EF6385A|nr:alpha/beta hydrolase [Frankia sp. CiP3]
MTCIYVAGIGNSGPEHWQFMWYKRGEKGVWVEHESWDAPVCDHWVVDLDAVLTATPGPKVIVAHSLGCPVVAAWAATHQDPSVIGAFLVAVPDVHGPSFPTEAVGFESLAYQPLSFPAVVVASDDDPYGSAEHAATVADATGAALVNVGAKGHINATSGLDDWPEGWDIFRGAPWWDVAGGD